MRIKVVDYSDDNIELSRRLVISKSRNDLPDIATQAYLLSTGELEVVCYSLYKEPPSVPDVGEPLKETFILAPDDWTIEEYNSFGQLIRVLTAGENANCNPL